MNNSEIKLIIPCEDTQEQIQQLANRPDVSFCIAPRTNFDGEMLCQISTIVLVPLIELIQLFLQIRELQNEKISIVYKGVIFNNIPMNKAEDFLKKLEESDKQS